MSYYFDASNKKMLLLIFTFNFGRQCIILLICDNIIYLYGSCVFNVFSICFQCVFNVFSMCHLFCVCMYRMQQSCVLLNCRWNVCMISKYIR